MNPTHDDPLVASLTDTARSLINYGISGGLDNTLVQVVRSAVETVPGADGAGITLATTDRIESRAPFDDAVLRLDQLQAELGEGPCLQAVTSAPLGGVVTVDDLWGADADRWPRFAAQAEPYGYRSMCSTQLSANGGVHAALNMYAHAPNTFDARARTVVGLFGVQAALLLFGVDRAHNLGIALGSRDVIGQAKGILMERFTVGSDHAFQMLVRSSQHTNMKLNDVAQWLVDERNRPGAAAPQKSNLTPTSRDDHDHDVATEKP